MYHPADIVFCMFPLWDTFAPHVFFFKKSEALICQDEGLVPIVEPDIVMKGDRGDGKNRLVGRRKNHLPSSQNRWHSSSSLEV